MQKTKNKAFTLVELLVVITILAIISVVAYQNFGWAVDKAVSGRKMSDVSTIETSLQQYKADKNYFPPTNVFDNTTEKWGYNSWSIATPSNPIEVVYDWQAISSLESSDWGWKVYWLDDWINDWSARQIWAKWTISMDTLWKKYLSKDLYDPEVWDIKAWTADLIESGIGRYVYATFKKSKDGDTSDWSQNYNWVDYNIAYTVKNNDSDEYVTKIVWSYDEESCYDYKDSCPETLIWSWTWVLTDWDIENWQSNSDNYFVPYAVTDFAATTP